MSFKIACLEKQNKPALQHHLFRFFFFFFFFAVGGLDMILQIKSDSGNLKGINVLEFSSKAFADKCVKVMTNFSLNGRTIVVKKVRMASC